MTACTDIQKKLPAYFEDVLDPEEKRRIEEHLSSCQQCSTTLATLRKTGDLLRNLEEVEPPPWLTEKIMAHVREEAEEKHGIFRRLFYPLHIKIPVEAFATLLVLVLGVYVYKATGPEMEAVAPPAAKMEETMPTEALSRQEQRKSTDTPVPEGEHHVSETPAGEKGSVPMPPPVESGKTADKKEDRGAESSLPQEAPSPAPPLREKDVTDSTGAAMSDRDEGKKFRAQLPSKSLKAEKAGVMTVAIEVNDIASAAAEVESLLNRFGATAISKETGSTATVLTAFLPARNVESFYDKLKAMGDMTQRNDPTGKEEGVVSMRLELSGKK